MKIQLFAGLAESLGQPAIELTELGASAKVSQVIAYMCEQYPEHAQVIQQCVPAINHAYATPDEIVSKNDEIALIPPVSGG